MPKPTKPPETSPPELMTQQQCAAYLHVSVSSIENYVHSGKLKAFKIDGGRRVLIHRDDLMAMLIPARVAETGEPNLDCKAGDFARAEALPVVEAPPLHRYWMVWDIPSGDWLPREPPFMFKTSRAYTRQVTCRALFEASNADVVKTLVLQWFPGVRIVTEREYPLEWVPQSAANADIVAWRVTG